MAANNSSKITKKEIIRAQKQWGNGLVSIGKVHSDRGYRAAKKEAAAFIKKYYNYQNGEVLFKPTLATEAPFRLDFAGALSYFVGGNPNYPEDKGFALTPYIHVAWENAGFTIQKDSALAMGNYFFYDTPDSFVKVEYSFGYIKDENGKLKIILQHSSLPDISGQE